MTVVTLIHSSDGDWTGIYLDNKLVDEGHSFSADMIMEDLIGKTIDKAFSCELDFESLDICECYPELHEYPHLNLRELKSTHE